MTEIITVKKMLNKRALVRPIVEQTEGFIMDVVDPAQAKIGKVLMAAEGMEVSVGDAIVYAPWAGSSITFRGEELLLIEQDDICCVLEV